MICPSGLFEWKSPAPWPLIGRDAGSGVLKSNRSTTRFRSQPLFLDRRGSTTSNVQAEPRPLGAVGSGAYWLASFLGRQLLDDASRKHLINLRMTRHGLGNFGLRVLEPIVLSAVPNENRSAFFYFSDEIPAPHANSSCACRRALGINPALRSR